MARLGRSQPTNVIYSDNIYSLPIQAGGTGAAAATGTGRLFVSVDGHGDAAAAVTASLNASARVAGHGDGTGAGTGLLIESARLAGTGANAAGVRAPLEIVGGHVDEAGQGTAAAGGTATLLFALDLAGHGDAVSGGTADITVGPPVLGYVAWYDATDLATITSVGNAVSAWADKSGNGITVTQADAQKQPSTGLRTICHHNTISFAATSGFHQGLAGSGLTLFDSVITVFVVAQFDTGGRLLSFTDGVQHDYDNTAGVSVLNFADGGSDYNSNQVTGADAGFSDLKAFVYDIRRDGGFWSANRDGVPFPGAFTIDTNFNATNVGVGGMPPNIADGGTGMVGEILVYAEALDPDEITAIELYLNTKWLLRGATLLDGHGDASDGTTGDLTVIPEHLVFIDGQGNASDGTNTAPLALGADLSGHGDTACASTLELRVLGAVNLNGQGTASATGTCRAVLAADLRGHGDVATTGTGIQIAQLVGHGDSSNTGAFDLIVRPQVDLQGHGDAATTATGAVRLAAALAGTGTAASIATGLVILTLALTGKGTAAVSTTTTLFGAVQDPDAAMLTILDDHHTDTIWDRGHTVTLIDG